MLIYILFIVSGFLSGSILYSVLIAKLVYGVDIITHSEDGNPGAANVFKYTDIKCGIIAMVLDILKGFIPVYAAAIYLDMSSLYFIPVMLAPVLGHVLAPLFKWRGGKAIAVSFGCLLGLIPGSYIVFALAIILFFFTFVIRIRPNSLRCMVSYSLFLIHSLLFGGYISLRLGCAMLAAIVVAKHIMAYKHSKPEIHIIPLDWLRKHGKSA